jgi:hypothetical protein
MYVHIMLQKTLDRSRILSLEIKVLYIVNFFALFWTKVHTRSVQKVYDKIFF